MSKEFSVSIEGEPSLDGEDVLPVEVLRFEMEQEAPPMFQATLDAIRQFAKSIVIDLGKQSQLVRITVEQIGVDGDVLERRQVRVGYSEDGRIRPGPEWGMPTLERRD